MDEILFKNLEKKSHVNLTPKEEQSFKKFSDLNLKVIENITLIDTSDVKPYSQNLTGFDLLREDNAE